MKIDEVKNYWNEHPCNANILSGKYTFEPHIFKFAKFEKWKDKKVLEIGCGVGSDTLEFVKAGASVSALELSDKSLEIAKKRIGDRANFYQGNAEELSKIVPVEHYDLIYSFGVIHHTLHPERIVEEILKYCHENTIIKVMLYHKYSWCSLLNWLKPGGTGEFKDCPIVKTYSVRQAKKLFTDNSFNILTFSVEYPLADSNLFRRLHLSNPITRFLTKPFGWHICLTMKL